MVAGNKDASHSSVKTAPEHTGEENHRKRRRNRMRVSCLNCYASKRKCDRKRPCTRCIKHGLTGLCVYELDDPTSRDNSHNDENTRLRHRIAELESVIRELNNRPHPRWFAPGGVKHDPSFASQRHTCPRPRRSRRVKAQEKEVRSGSVEAFFASIADGDEDANVDDEDVKVKMEREESEEYAPEFTPSEAGPSDSGLRSSVESPLTPLSPFSVSSPLALASAPRAPILTFPSVSSLSAAGAGIACNPSPDTISAPFSFHDDPYASPFELSPSLSSFVQGAREDNDTDSHTHTCSSASTPTSTSTSTSTSAVKSQRNTTTDCLSPSASESSDEGPPLANLFPASSKAAMSPSVYSSGYSAQSSRRPSITSTTQTTSIGIQTSPTLAHISLASPSSPPPASLSAAHDSHTDLDPPCRCLTNPTVYSPLVHFASALRTSREALEPLHFSGSASSRDCVLFRGVVELDEYIFSASPPTPHASPQLEISSVSVLDSQNFSHQPPLSLSIQTHALPTDSEPELEPEIERTPTHTPTLTLTPSSPPPSCSFPFFPFDAAAPFGIRHPHAHSLPFYTPPPPALPLAPTFAYPGDSVGIHQHQYYEPSQQAFDPQVELFAYPKAIAADINACADVDDSVGY